MPKTPHVGLLIESSGAYGRGLLEGIGRYLREHGPWSVYFRPQDLGAPVPRWLKRWKGDGILARINDLATAKVIRRMGLPAVDLRLAIPQLGIPQAGIDNREVVRLAFEHLRNTGLRRFAFCGIPRGRSAWMDLRKDLFRQLVEDASFPFHLYQELARPAQPDWEKEQAHIAAWVARLPKPVGVVANNDDRALQVVDACGRAGV